MKSSVEATIKNLVALYIRTKLIWVAVVIVIFALIALQRFLWATETFGIGIRTDSVAYLWSSENLAKGVGLGRLDGAGNFRPYTHWPPLYPILLTIPRLMEFDGMASARIIGALCIALLIVVTGLSVARLTRLSPFYTACALVVLINAPNLWITSLFAMTEPLYIVLSLSALLLLDKYFSNSRKYLLILSSLLAGLALVTRYVGFSLIAASLLVILIQKERSWNRKIKDSFTLAALSLIPFIAWAIRNTLVAGTSTNRTLALVPIALVELQNSLNAILEWFNPVLHMSPLSFIKPVLIGAVVFISCSLYYKYSTPNKMTREYLGGLIAFYSLFYVLTTVLARLFFDQNIPLQESRIQLPLFVSIFLLLISFFFAFQEKARFTGWMLPAILATLYVISAWIFARDYIKVSLGSNDSVLVTANRTGAGMVWHSDTPLVTVINKYPLREYRFFTDNIEKLYFVSSLYSYQLLSSQTSQADRVLSEMDELGVVLVLFDNRSWGPELQLMIPGLELIYSGTADVYIAPSR